ncbi:hypothetical protein ES692_17620 [Psychroserpens burtonensis]|uniref:PQQ-binding-like beta-propeller repeat protein n=1 Tax=Psychroserpens burtonensis TaxID=49278 RepID=A0A5C7B1D1_9FLAO|nr:hypothetical protein [Psychroserpens burtonensis]TXE14916.1 hypothetical protein ES692_17620 [Psychroserpens burtonensis]
MKNILNILIILLTFSVQGQISESWNLNIDSYTHNSSNYASKFPPIEIAEFSNGDNVVLSQNGTLVKLNANGEIIWRNEIKTCAQQRILIDSNDYIIFSCGTEITKFDSNGEIIWNKDYSNIFSKKYLTFDAITSDNGNLYVAGHFFHSKHICQLSIDKNGNVLWKTKFKQDVDYEFSFLPPKQIVVFDNTIFILAHHYTKSNSFLYSSNLKGKKRKEKQVDFKIKKIKSFENSLFALGHLNNLKDKLIFGKVDEGLELSNISELKLPRNLEYNENSTGWATKPPTKEEFEREYITAYNVNDFEFLNTKNLLIVGNSSGKPWILNLNLDNGITWNWDIADDRYFKFDNKYTSHYYVLYSINQVGNKYLISGISEEQDDQENRFVKYVNLFVREIEMEK